MLRTTALGLAAAASLSLAALTPALADVPTCVKQPNADTCPTFGSPTPSAAATYEAPHRHMRHGHYRAIPENAYSG